MPSRLPTIKRGRRPTQRPRPPREPSFIPDGWQTLRSSIEDVGRKIYPDLWNGREAEARRLLPLGGLLEEDHLADAREVISWSGFSPRQYQIQLPSISDYENERAEAERFCTACNWLRQRLWGGELAASTFQGEHRRVAQAEWYNDTFFQVALMSGMHIKNNLGYLFISTSELARLLNGPSSESAPASTIKAEGQCRAWLVGLMKATPTSEKPKLAYASEAKALFGVGSKAFSRAWANAVQEASAPGWSRPGRKS
jgi:hypothetical protein